MMLGGEGLPMVVLSIILRLSGDRYVVVSLLLGGIQWWPVVNFPWFVRIILFLFA